MNDDFGKLSDDIAQFAALDAFRVRGTEQMERFTVDCHPWNGVIALGFLTTAEIEASPFLADAGEMAAWKYYDFASELFCSRPELGSRMRELYEQQADDRAKVAERFFVACALAIATTPVQEMLSKYKLSKSFRITIPHPDTGVEFCHWPFDGGAAATSGE